MVRLNAGPILEELKKAAAIDGGVEYLPHEPLIPLMDQWLAEIGKTRDYLQGGNSTDADIRATEFEDYLQEIYPELSLFVIQNDAMLCYATIQAVIN